MLTPMHSTEKQDFQAVLDSLTVAILAAVAILVGLSMGVRQ